MASGTSANRCSRYGVKVSLSVLYAPLAVSLDSKLRDFGLYSVLTVAAVLILCQQVQADSGR